MENRKSTFLFLLLACGLVGHCPSLAFAQIMEIHGRPDSPDFFVCSRSGLKGMGSDCGTEYYDSVFTAEILSVTSEPNNELRLTLRPQKIFKGKPEVGVQVITSQWRCLPPMRAGDSWLFFLKQNRDSKELIVSYGGRSGPVEDKKQEIQVLGRLVDLDSAGVLKGRAYRYQQKGKISSEQVFMKDHEIVLTGEDGRKIKTTTNEDGNFEFNSIPAGKYDSEPNTEAGLWTRRSGTITVEPHSCKMMDLDFVEDGQIAGRLVFPLEVDPNMWEVEATPLDDPDVFPASTWTDNAGNFVLHGLRSGKYLVVIKKTEMRKGPNLSKDLYAPGDPERDNGRIIKLEKAARVEGVELFVPRSAIEARKEK